MLVAFVVYCVLLDYESLMMYVFCLLFMFTLNGIRKYLTVFACAQACAHVCCEHVHLKLSAMMWRCVWCWTCKSVWMPCTTHKCVTAATQRQCAGELSACHYKCFTLNCVLCRMYVWCWWTCTEKWKPPPVPTPTCPRSSRARKMTRHVWLCLVT